MKVFTISFVFSIATLFILVLLDSSLANLYCVWPLHLLATTGFLGDNLNSIYHDWYEVSMTVSLLTQTLIIYLLTARLSKKKV
ncbi:hypothetical protein [Psychromonas aquatilis]|uniref:Uncharacterized protein n=1 Tax=Psychromonas aquatilis TaxID=2005072 RepID=A0ABU9GLU7_9GAMM